MGVGSSRRVSANDDDGTPGAHQAGEALLDVAADDGEAVRQSKLVFLA